MNEAVEGTLTILLVAEEGVLVAEEGVDGRTSMAEEAAWICMGVIEISRLGS